MAQVFRRSSPTRWRAFAALFSVISLVLSTPTLAAPMLGDSWLPGPGALGENTYSGVIDAPIAAAQVTTSGAVQMAG